MARVLQQYCIAWEPRSKNMIHLLRSAISLGLLCVVSLSAHALPVAISSVDRDVVRDPYNSFSLNLSKGPVIAVPSTTSTAAFASGAGFGGTVLPPAVGSARFSNSASINGFLTSSLPFSFVPPPRNPPAYFAIFDQPRQSNVQIGPVQVPDAAVTFLLLGGSLLPLYFFHRARVKSGA